MPIVQARCSSCGGSLEINNSSNTSDVIICPYCDTPYFIERNINGVLNGSETQAKADARPEMH